MHQNAELLGNVIRPVLENAAPLVSEEDLHLSHLVLKLATTITSRFPDSTKSIKELLFPRVLALLESKILQGHALVVRSLVLLFPMRSLPLTPCLSRTHWSYSRLSLALAPQASDSPT